MTPKRSSHSLATHKDCGKSLASELPDDVEYEPCGTVWVAADDEEMQEVERKSNYYGERGVTAHVLDEKQLRTLEPNLRSGMKGGLLVPEDGVLYPPCAARFFTESAQKLERRLHLVFRLVILERAASRSRMARRCPRPVHSERRGDVGARPYSRTRDQEA